METPKLMSLSLLTSCCLALGLFATGCASSKLGREAQNSDGFFDFAWAVAGHPRKDVVPVQRISARGGEITTAHAESAGEGQTRVSGIVKKDFGYGAIEDAHIDVRVLGPGGRLIAGQATTYFPRPIPADYHGTIGRSHYSAKLSFIPPPDSTVQVAFHNSPLEKCEFALPYSNL